MCISPAFLLLCMALGLEFRVVRGCWTGRVESRWSTHSATSTGVTARYGDGIDQPNTYLLNLTRTSIIRFEADGSEKVLATSPGRVEDFFGASDEDEDAWRESDDLPPAGPHYVGVPPESPSRESQSMSSSYWDWIEQSGRSSNAEELHPSEPRAFFGQPRQKVLIDPIRCGEWQGLWDTCATNPIFHRVPEEAVPRMLHFTRRHPSDNSKKLEPECDRIYFNTEDAQGNPTQMLMHEQPTEDYQRQLDRESKDGWAGLSDKDKRKKQRKEVKLKKREIEEFERFNNKKPLDCEAKSGKGRSSRLRKQPLEEFVRLDRHTHKGIASSSCGARVFSDNISNDVPRESPLTTPGSWWNGR